MVADYVVGHRHLAHHWRLDVPLMSLRLARDIAGYHDDPVSAEPDPLGCGRRPWRVSPRDTTVVDD